MRQANLREVLHSLGAAAEAGTVDELGRAVMAAAVAVVGADSAVVTHVGSLDSEVDTWPDDFLSIEQQVTFERLNATDPWPLATHTRVGGGEPLRISDLFGQRAYRGLRIYRELFRLIEVDNQVAFSIPVGFGQRLCVALDRSGRDFSAAELDCLAALRRPLIASAVHVVRSDRLAPGTPLRQARLSRRESDVLSLLAGGLGNDQIGRRLGISTRTVHKHLEHVYAKVGVTNRTQASARWFRAQLAEADRAGAASGHG